MNEERETASLDSEYEASLWQQMASGDDDAREKLILAYRPMVFWLARKFRVPYGTYPDLIQEGMVGLIAAVDNFDSARNNRFTTYAYYKVHGRMSNFLQRSEMKAPLPVEDEYLERPFGRESFESSLDRMEWKIALEGGMCSLPQKEMEVVRSMMIDGRKAVEVAQEHGVGVSHVYRIQRKALAQLRKFFAAASELSENDATTEA